MSFNEFDRSCLISCCNNCVPPKRTPTCHSYCEDYIKARQAQDEKNEKKRKEQKKYEIVQDVVNTRTKRILHIQKKKMNANRKTYR